MSYAIIRNANYKKKKILAGLYKHNEKKNTNYSKEINKNNSLKELIQLNNVLILLI